MKFKDLSLKEKLYVIFVGPWVFIGGLFKTLWKGLVKDDWEQGDILKILKVILILLATALMAAVMIFVSDASVVDMMAGTYALSVNAFLGVDLANGS